MSTLPFEVLGPAQLRARTSIKWQHYGPDVLPLWVAEMDVLPAPEVVEALVRAARTGDTGYPGAGHRYAESFAAFAERRWGWRPDPADTLVCADVMSGIRALVQHLTPRGGTVLIPSPVYPPFRLFAAEVERRVVQVPLTDAGRLDLEVIETALAEAAVGPADRSDAGTPDPRPGRAVLLLCSPHNPTGAVHTREELLAVAAAAERSGAVVVVDEVHAPLVPAGAAFEPWLALTDSGYVVTSAAKAFNLPGLKAGVIVAGAVERGQLARLPESVKYGASHLGVIGHTAAWDADPAWLDGVNANIAVNRAALAALLADRLPQVGYRSPESTYLAWLDCRELGLGADPADAFLRRGRVALTNGPPFGVGGAGHARINLACSAAVLAEAVDRMAGVVGAAR